MSARIHTQSEDIDLGALLAGLRRAFPRLLIASVGVGALTFAVLSLMAPRYSAEVQLAIVAKTTNPFPDSKDKGASPDMVTPRLDREAINTHVRAIASSDLILKVAEKLKLETMPEFNSEVGAIDTFDRLTRMMGLSGPRSGENVNDRVLTAVNQKLQVAAAKESRFIEIKFSSIDPELAASFANGLAQSYRNRLVDVPVRETNDAVKALMPKIEQLRREVVDADAEVERFRARTDQFRSGPQSTPVNDQRMASLNEELSKAEASRSEVESRWRTARELSRTGSADVLPEVQKSQVMQGLINQRVRLERQVSEASAVLLPAHPRMRQLNADLAGLKRSIDAEITKILQGLDKEQRSAALRVEDLKRQVTLLKTKVVNTSGDEAELKSREAAAKAKRAELERLQKQFEDNKTLIVTRSVPVEAQIVSAARASGIPTFPKKAPYALLAAATTLLLGLAFNVARLLVTRGQPQTAGAHRPMPQPTSPDPVSPAPVPPSTRASDRRSSPKSEPALDHTPNYAHEPAYAAPAAAVASSAGVPADRMAMFGNRGGAAAAAVATGVVGGAGAVMASSGKSSELSAPAVSVAVTRTKSDELSALPAETVTDNGVSMLGVGRHILERRDPSVGYRTMIASEQQNIDPTDEALSLVSVLEDAGARVLLVDWSPEGSMLAEEMELSGKPGIGDVLAGTATFEQVIHPIPGLKAHYVASGTSVAMHADELDSDGLNLALDALDEAYDQILVVGRFEAARSLFEAIQGRFDAGIVVGDVRRRVSVLEAPETSFLGFEVTEIDVIRVERSDKKTVAARRMELDSPLSVGGEARA